MNFSITFIEIGENTSFNLGEQILFEKLEKNEINMFAIPSIYYLSHNYSISQILIEGKCREFIAIAPIIPQL